jgi:serine/threonine-protein kinase
MSHELPSEKAALTHSEQVRLDEMLDRFEAAWKRWQSGPPPRIEDFAANTSSRLRVELVSEMVKLDREYRDKHAMPKELAEYVRDLPELEGFSTSLPGIPAASPPIASTSPAHRAPKGRRNTTPVRIGPYRIIKKLGGGGQADAYLAVDELLGHEVVIKLSNYPLDGQDPARDRLATEGQILAKLDHTAIVKVYAAGVDEDYPYLVLERVEGQTLEQFVGGGRLSARRAAQLVAQVARGADLANRHGVIHQDINPRNVLIDVFGNAKLIDFGLAYVKDAWQDAIEDRRSASTNRSTVAPMYLGLGPCCTTC